MTGSDGLLDALDAAMGHAQSGRGQRPHQRSQLRHALVLFTQGRLGAVIPGTSIEEVECSPRVHNFFKRINLLVLEDVCRYSYLELQRLGYRQVGQKHFAEIEHLLKERGLQLRREVA